MGIPADELEGRMSEAEFREHFEDLGKEPDASGKLDVIIALLWSICEANVSLAGSWIKGYQPPNVADKVPLWGRRKRKTKGPIDPSVVLALVSSMTSQRPDNLSG